MWRGMLLGSTFIRTLLCLLEMFVPGHTLGLIHKFAPYSKDARHMKAADFGGRDGLFVGFAEPTLLEIGFRLIFISRFPFIYIHIVGLVAKLVFVFGIIA